jgi:hypothetical protein
LQKENTVSRILVFNPDPKCSFISGKNSPFSVLSEKTWTASNRLGEYTISISLPK